MGAYTHSWLGTSTPVDGGLIPQHCLCFDTDVCRSDGTDAGRPRVNFVERCPGRKGGPHYLRRWHGAVSHADDTSPQLLLHAPHVGLIDRTLADARHLAVNGLLQLYDRHTRRRHDDDRQRRLVDGVGGIGHAHLGSQP